MEYTNVNYTKDYEFIHPCGDKVLLKKVVKSLDKKYGDILIPKSVAQNNSFGLATVVELGNSESIKDSGIQIGDYVLYDYYSVYNDNPEYVITKIENIILQLSVEEAKNYLEKRVIWN